MNPVGALIRFTYYILTHYFQHHILPSSLDVTANYVVLQCCSSIIEIEKSLERSVVSVLSIWIVGYRLCMRLSTEYI